MKVRERCNFRFLAPSDGKFHFCTLEFEHKGPHIDASYTSAIYTPAIETTESQGGVKDDSDKLRFDLMPPGPLMEVIKVFTLGANKYADRNWEKGLDFGRVFAAMQRHAWGWWNGEEIDPEDGQHHLSSVAWCALALLELIETHPERDDRPASLRLKLLMNDPTVEK